MAGGLFGDMTGDLTGGLGDLTSFMSHPFESIMIFIGGILLFIIVIVILV